MLKELIIDWDLYIYTNNFHLYFCKFIQNSACFKPSFSSENTSLQSTGIQSLTKRAKVIVQLSMNWRSIRHELNANSCSIEWRFMLNREITTYGVNVYAVSFNFYLSILIDHEVFLRTACCIKKSYDPLKQIENFEEQKIFYKKFNIDLKNTK